ncbi:hypothetical protein JXJ21_11280 [candidate division KSB1 bacterium]|nr:hypothetical protein [candidate division KSB1 bacterium]
MRELKLGDLLTDAWEVYKTNIGVWILASLLYYVLISISAVLCYFPVFFVAPPLTAGMYLIALNHLRYNRVEIGDLFKGFENYGAVLVTALVMIGISILCYLPGIIFQVIGAIITQASYESGGGFEAIGVVFSVFGVLLYLAGLVPIFYFMTRFLFVFLLIMDKKIGFKEAYQLSKEKVQEGFWNALLIYIVSAVVGSIGMFACGIGILFTFPLMFIMQAVAYHRLYTPEMPTILSAKSQ